MVMTKPKDGNKLKPPLVSLHAWIQVMPKMRILVFSFCGYAYSNTEESVEHTNNDNLLAAIFEIASQYGDIPVLIGGRLPK